MTKEELHKYSRPFPLAQEEIQAVLDQSSITIRREFEFQEIVVGKLPEDCEHNYVIHPGGVEHKPYRAGDCFFAQEIWCEYEPGHITDSIKYIHKSSITLEEEKIRKAYGYNWSHAMSMPKEAARFFFQVKNIWAEIREQGKSEWVISIEKIIPEPLNGKLPKKKDGSKNEKQI